MSLCESVYCIYIVCILCTFLCKEPITTRKWKRISKSITFFNRTEPKKKLLQYYSFWYEMIFGWIHCILFLKFQWFFRVHIFCFYSVVSRWLNWFLYCDDITVLCGIEYSSLSSKTWWWQCWRWKWWWCYLLSRTNSWW